MEREYFIFYRSFYEAIRELPDAIQLEVFRAISEYALYGQVPDDLKPFARGMFVLMKPNIDVNTSRYENGKKGGRPAVPAPQPAPKRASSGKNAKPSYTSFDEEIALLKKEPIWCESTCMQFHIDTQELDSRLAAFVTHCNVERGTELHPTLTDARRHFASWVRKAYPADKKSQEKNPRPDDYSFRGGFGGKDQ